MSSQPEGEIIVKEKYGSSSTERIYIKPPEQAMVVVYDETKINYFRNWFTNVFLPKGYPDSVSRDYSAYQIWDTAQAFCSTITGTLATQEVLRGVGVGDTTATPLAATVTWVIKDGCGHLGRILFAFTHGTCLDAYSKKWRLYADTLNDAAMCIEIALPYFKNYTTVVLCVSTVMKAIVGVSGGATRAAMTQHHAVRGNMADVSAKDSAQETAVNLIASFTALFIISVFGSNAFIFVFIMMLHIAFNYFAVRAVCLRTMNEPRFLEFINIYLTKERIATPCEVNRREPVAFYQMGSHTLDLKLCGFQIKMGVSIKDLIKKKYPKASHLKNIKDVYENRNYIIIPNVQDRKMYVLLNEKAMNDDILRAYFHAVLLSVIICVINDVPLPVYQAPNEERPFAQVCCTIQTTDWSREPIETHVFNEFKFEPSYDLMKYVNRIVQREWMRIKTGMMRIGWDLNKHLLMVDEWRISSVKPLSQYAPIEGRVSTKDYVISEADAKLTKELLMELEHGDGVTYGVVETKPLMHYKKEASKRRVHDIGTETESPEIEEYREPNTEAEVKAEVPKENRKKD